VSDLVIALRVETQVYVLVNDKHALDFMELNHVTGDGTKNWFHHNEFDEQHAHAVRNLVKNPVLLSKITY